MTSNEHSIHGLPDEQDGQEHTQIERLIALQGLPQTRGEFDRSLLRTIETLEQAREFQRSEDRKASHRGQRVSVAFLVLLLCMNGLSYSIGRSHRPPASAIEHGTYAPAMTTTESSSSLVNAVVDHLAQAQPGEETVWGSRAQLENLRLSVQPTQPFPN